MARFKRMIVIFLCVIITITSLSFSASISGIENEKKYKPLDLVLVLDTSGSMKESDKDRTALAAVRMLVNMMPAGDSRVGVVKFNQTATVITKDPTGKDALLSLDSLTNVATIRKNVSDIVYTGDTGIGNAVFAATKLLEANSSDERAQAIILFTDGVNDFGNDMIALSKCEENEASALLWAKKNNCPIYSVGYDYTKFDGTSSMGKSGEGIKKLQDIASTTSGKFRLINTIGEIEQLLIEFLADVCDLNYKTVATIPGDGNEHECRIPVSPSVIEANIRIAGGDENSIATGELRLFDPSGNEIELRNSGNVRFDTDATAASIKVTMPKTGEWLLVVKGIKGEDIHVGLLEHFKMNLTSAITLPKDNPDGVAYSNDEVGIKTWLSYDGQNLNDEAIYAAVKSATAVCVPRANPENKKIIQLQRDGLSFVGSFIIPQDCFYDITIRLDWDTVYREDTLTVASSNKPVALIKEIDDVKVNKGKTIQIKDLFTYVKDDENDHIDVYVKSVLKSDVCDIEINGDVLTLTGVKGWWTNTLVTIAFKDAQGNEVESTFEVSVGDPAATALVVSIIVLIILLIVLLIYFAFRARIHLFGKMRVCEISEGSIDAAGNFTRNTNGFSYINPNATRNSHNRGNMNPTGGSGGGNATTSGNGLFGGGQTASASGNGLFGGGQTASASGNGLFGGGQNASASNNGLFGGGQTASASNSGLFGGGQTVSASNNGLFGGGQTASDPSNGVCGGGNHEDEFELSNRFNEVYNFGGKRTKKASMEMILDGFVNLYTDFMTRQLAGGRSVLAEDLKTRLSSIRVQTSKMQLTGTAGGKGGAKLTVDNSALKKEEIVMSTPRLVKNKAELQYYDKGVVPMDFCIVTDKQNDVRRGIRVSVEFERN